MPSPRQPHRKRRSRPQFTGDCDAAAVRLYNRFADRQAKPNAAICGAARFVGAIKSLKYPRQIFSSDALPCIANRKRGRARPVAHVHVDFASRFIVMDRVAKQVGNGLLEAVRIAANDGWSNLAMNLDFPLSVQRAAQVRASL